MTKGTVGEVVSQLGKALVAQLAYRSGALELVNWVSSGWRGQRRRVLVLAYHRVVEDFGEEATRSIPSRLISRSTFARHLELLRRDYDVMPLAEAVRQMCQPEGAAPAAGDDPGRPLAAITFDHGYEEVHRNAGPILRQFGFPFTVFVVSGYTGTGRRLPHDRLHHLLLALLSRPAGPGPLLPAALRSRLARAGLELGGTPAPSPARGGRRPRRSGADRPPWVLSLQAASAVAELQAGLSPAELECLEAELRAVLAGPADPPGARLLDWDQVVDLARHGATIGVQSADQTGLEPELATVKDLADAKADLELAVDRAVRCFAYPEQAQVAALATGVSRAGFEVAVTSSAALAAPLSPLRVPRKTLWEMSSHGLLGPSSAQLAAELGDLYGQLGWPVAGAVAGAETGPRIGGGAAAWQAGEQR